MRDIRLPETSDKSIDISAIDTSTEGIILAYKGNKPIGFIGYADLWYFCDNIDSDQFDTCKGTLLEVVNELIDTKHIADNFRLLEFYTNNDD